MVKTVSKKRVAKRVARSLKGVKWRATEVAFEREVVDELVATLDRLYVHLTPRERRLREAMKAELSAMWRHLS